VEEGWLALQTGKWWQGDFKRGGFTHGMTVGGRHGDAGLEIGRKTLAPIFDFVADARKAEKPFFIWYAPMMPHQPHTPPQRLLDKYKDAAPSLHIAKYWAMVEWFDETVGDLLAFLEKEGLAENTIVAYVADNGWIQNTDEPKYAPRSKQSQYDGGLRTPIMLRWPGRIVPRKSGTIISSLDLYPTVMKACGVKFAEDLPGVDLLDDAAIAARKTIFGECFTHNSKDLTNPAASLRWRYVIEDGWKRSSRPRNRKIIGRPM
jgi:arylsulfatase A-like enzyme